ncbi:Transcription factor bHLH168 [Linum perenne]
MCVYVPSVLIKLVLHLCIQHLLSQPDQVDHAAAYIKKLSQRIEKLNKKKEDLLAASTSRHHGGTSRAREATPRNAVVEVNESGPSIEVTLVSGVQKSFMLHEVLSIIEEEGAEVVSANFSTVGSKTFHTIHARVRICRVGVETSRVRQRLQEIIYF